MARLFARNPLTNPDWLPMIAILTQMFTLILCGVGWRVLNPAGLGADQTRAVLVNVVYYLLLPPLVLSVLWNAEMGLVTISCSVIAISSILLGGLVFWLLFRLHPVPRAQEGAIMLAAIFPNVTYLGLPVLDQTYGHWATSVAIQLDLFACTPMLFTFGVYICRHFGETRQGEVTMLASLFRIPAIWAAFLAIVLQSLNVTQPEWIHDVLDLLARGVVPLMLISLGLGLRWESLHWRNLPKVIPLVGVKLLLQPLIALLIAQQLNLDEKTMAAVVLEIAMPSMVIGLVFCDRYRLDTALYAMAVTITTALSLLTLPLWFSWL